MDLRAIKLALLLSLMFMLPQFMWGQAANLQGFGGTIQQPFRSGDLVLLYGTNLTSLSCDSLLLYTGGTPGDTVKYSSGASFDTPLKYVRVAGAGGVDTLKFRLHKNVACSPNTFVRFRKRPSCPTGAYQLSNLLFMETGKKAEITYGGNDSTYCVGDTNVLPIELQDDVFYTMLFAPGFMTTGDTFNLVDSTGAMNVTSNHTGTYYIRIYTDTLAPGHPTCNHDDTVKVQILAMSTDVFSYGVSHFCPSLTVPQSLSLPPSDTGGVFSAFPATLTLNASTGQITPSSSTPRTYQVTYTPPHAACTSPTTITMYIDTVSQTVFNYPTGICSGDTSEIPFLTQYADGNFSVLALAGFSGSATIDTATGRLISTPNTTGPVRVTFTPDDACRLVTTQTVNYLRLPTADFTVGNNGVICLSTAGPSIPLVPVSPSATGVWTAPGLTLGVNSIVNNASTPIGGPFYVSYYKDSIYAAFNNVTCGDSFVVPVMIYGTENVDITYPNSDSGYCDGDQILTPVFTSGILGGVYSSNVLSGSGNFAPNPVTGVINLAAGSTEIELEVLYQPHAACPDIVAIDTISITPDKDLGLGFASAPGSQFLTVCTTDSLVQLQNTGSTLTTILWDSIYVAGNGSTTATFPGVVNGANEFLVGNIPAGGYYPIIRYTEYGGCENSDTIYIEIIQTAFATFDYLDDLYCQGSTNPVPFISGVGGGTFSCTTSAQFNQQLDPVTGEIDLSTFLVGTYTIRYVTNAVEPTCPDTAYDVVQFIGFGSAEFDYDDQISFCTSDTNLVIMPNLGDSLSQDTWLVTPGTGLSLDTSNGHITLASSLPGTYVVERSIGQAGGTCNSIFTVEIEIKQGDVGTLMNYADNVYCQNDPNPLPIIVGTQTGAFYGQLGVQLNGTTGEINLLGSEVNDTIPFYIITYRIESINGCVVEHQDTIRIVGLNATNFAYPQEFICKSSPLVSPSALPIPSTGTYYMVSTAGDTVNYINPATGDIDVTNANILGAERFEIFFYPIDTSCSLVAKVDLAVYQGPDPNAVVIDPGTSFCDLETIHFVKNDSATGNLWFYINGGDVTNISWGGQNSDEFQSLDWNDGDVVTVYVYSPVADTLRDSVSGLPVANNLGGYFLDTSSTCVLRYDYTLQERPLPVLSFVNPVDVVDESDQVRADLATTVDGTSVNWQIAFINNIDTTVVQTGTSGSTFDIGGIYQYLQYITLDDSVSPGSIQVTFIPTANGCVGAPLIDTISINPVDIPIFIPEVFTPDGEDEFNPTWNIQWTDDINPMDYEILVYNRSGGLVERLPNLHPNWTGDSAPDGVYWWVMIEKASNQITKSGGLTIKRK